MKRDLDLIRLLLLRLEDMGSSHAVRTLRVDNDDMAIDGYEPEVVEYHLSLLYEAGYIETGTCGSGVFPDGSFSFRRLSWRGHEVVDAIRDPKVYRKVKGA